MESELIKIDKLQNASEWTRWKFQIKVLLNASELFEVVSGDNPKPILAAGATADEQAKYSQSLRDWKKLDHKAQKVIATTVGQQPLIHIMNYDTAKDMWDKLHRVYAQKSESSVHMLQQSFYLFEMDPKDSIASHISKLEDLAQQLKDLGEPVSTSMIITKILMTLPPNFSHFNSAWESTSSADRTIENLTSRLMVEEARLNQAKQNQVVGESTSESSAFSARNQVNRNYNRGATSSRPGKCFICNKSGHWRRDCPVNKQANCSWEDEAEAFVSEAFASEAVFYSSARHRNGWFLDSGASDHMCNRRDWFVGFKSLKVPIPVRIGNGKFINAYGRGNIHIEAFDGERWNKKILLDVLFVPDIQLQLISLTTALDKNLTFSAESSQCCIKKDGHIVAVGERNKRLFEMKFKVAYQERENDCSALMADTSMKLWHERLGHQNAVHVQNVLKDLNIASPKAKDFFCEACAIGKQHRLPFKKSFNGSNTPAELIHSDVCGPMQVASIGGARYFLLFKDDYSHFRTISFLKQKSEVKMHINTYLRSAKADTGFDVKLFRSDNGTEFVNIDVETLLKELGIRHQRTVPSTPEQNGSAEREMRTIVESARTMLHAKELPIRLWAEATNTAVYVLNRIGTSSVRGITPFELWFGRKPSIQHLRIFGSKVFVHIPKKRKKWDKKSEEGVFVGYSENTKGYRIWIPNKNQVVIRRDVIFQETLSQQTVNNVDRSEASVKSSDMSPSVSDVVNIPNNETSSVPQSKFIDQDVNNKPSPPTLDLSSVQEEDQDSPSSPVREFEVNSSSGSEDTFSSPNSNNSPNINGFFNPIDTDPATSRRGDPRLRNISPVLTYKDLSSSFIDESSLYSAESLEPLSYEQAIKCEDSKMWIVAINDEYKSLMQNKTWSLVELPKDRRAIDNRWVFKIKHKADGSIQRYKARLVVRGFSQQHGIDYQETFSPVAKFSSIRTILAISTAERMVLRQFDVKTAFLYGELQEEIYMKQPIGYDDNSGKVCLLKRSLYGLKQASRVWNQKFTDFLKTFGLEMSKADPCVFIGKSGDKIFFLAIYIDDGLIAAHDERFVDNLLYCLNKEFQTTAGELEYFLGLEIESRRDGSLHIHQNAYAQKLLKKFGMENCHPVATPADQHHQMSPLSYQNECKGAGSVPFREAVGSLMYLVTGTRPDIAFAVSQVSRYLENPLEIHWNAVKRIFRYIKGTTKYGITFNSNVKKVLVGYSDADYGGDIDTRRSTTGFVFKIGSGPISWCSQRQRTVALSTTEAEYVAASESLKELVWLQVLLGELAPNVTTKPLLMVDNESAIKLTKNPEFHKRTKHIDIRHHFIRERYNQGSFNLTYIQSNDQIADIFTKALAKDKFIRFRSMMGITQ